MTAIAFHVNLADPVAAIDCLDAMYMAQIAMVGDQNRPFDGENVWIIPQYAPGVGTPVAGGLTYREAHLACEKVAHSGRLLGMDLVELNPILDEDSPERAELVITDDGPGFTPTGQESGMGSRLLRHWLHHPLRDRALVGARHEAVAALADPEAVPGIGIDAVKEGDGVRPAHLDLPKRGGNPRYKILGQKHRRRTRVGPLRDLGSDRRVLNRSVRDRVANQPTAECDSRGRA